MHLQLAAHCLRRDAARFLKALGIFSRINLKTAFLGSNGHVAIYAITHACYCFDLSLADEGFQLVGKANSVDINCHQLAKVKSLT